MKTYTDKLAAGLSALVFLIIPFHAFITVWASTLVGHFVLLRLWKELILIILSIIVCYWLVSEKELRQKVLNDRLIRLIALYIILTVVLGLISYFLNLVTPKALGYALISNLRFMLWFGIIFIIAARSNWLLNHWHKLIFWPLSIVVVFGILQFFILPHDFLMHFGYNNSHSLTYVDGLTLNQDSSILRVQSTMRGSNQLGAYLVVGISLIIACYSFLKKSYKMWALGVLSFIALVLTFSRSAWLGMLVSALTLLAIKLKPTQRTLIRISILALCCLAVGIIALRNNNTAHNVILHENTRSTAAVTSNSGHISALKNSLQDFRARPFGEGPGTAGQASIYNLNHEVRNTESYWLQISLEVGVLGLLLMGFILYYLGRELWYRRTDGLALGLFASLLGLIVINFLAYGFADDTLAYIWWGLAGIALAPYLNARKIT